MVLVANQTQQRRIACPSSGELLLAPSQVGQRVDVRVVCIAVLTNLVGHGVVRVVLVAPPVNAETLVV